MKDRIGTVVWSELQTTQIEEIKGLWSDIFAYKWEKFPLQKKINYHIASVHKEKIYGLVQLPAAIKKTAGGAFHLYFFSVENLDEMKQKALSFGAKIVVDEILLNSIGRWSILTDPLGGVFCMVEMKGKPIPFASKIKGTHWWYELICKDPAKSAFFYGKIFDWDMEELKISPEETHYVAKNKKGELVRTSLRPMDSRLKEANIPDFWLGFLCVKDIDQACKKVIEYGGTVLSETEKDIEGRYAWLSLPDKSLIGFIEA